MYNKIKAMWSIFKNNNDWNEKTIVGFIAFLVMVAFALLDLTTGYLGKDLVVYVDCNRLFWYCRCRKIRR